VLIYKIDNTTFGDDIPTLPQWIGPPPAMEHVQTILYASLAASLLSALLAMLGKQWLNRYASTDVRGSAVERSQNRQRKLDGIIRWYFDSVLESLPLMLQVALLLLGCALSRYLWEISRTIASVVIGVTSFGLLFYLFILAVGTAWESCPYQTPGSTFFRYLGPRVPRIVYSAASATGNILKASVVAELVTYVRGGPNSSSWHDVIFYLADLALGVPISFAMDIYSLGRATVKRLPALPVGAYRLLRRVHTWFHSSPRGFDQQTAALDLRCILWTLQTSLDKLVHISTLQHLIMITDFTTFDSDLVMDCFNIFVGCISFSNDKVVVTKGLEQLATLSAMCFSRTLDHLSATNPTSSVLADLHQRYHQIFTYWADFRGLPFLDTMAKIHKLINRGWDPPIFWWTDYRPADQELVPLTRCMVELARAEHQRLEATKVPRWILRFALRFLSLDPPSPPSVIADCLTIIAIALDLNPSNVPMLDER
jgi:hypothetical protein